MKEKKSLGEVITELEAKLNDKVSDCMKAIKEANLTSYNASLNELAALEEQYNEAKTVQLYNELAKAEQPIIEAIKTYSQPVKKHRVITDKETKAAIAVELVDRERQIDLLKFCRRVKLDVSWQYDVEKFNQLLTLRAAKELGCTQNELKNIAKSYGMHEQAIKIEMGGTPTSNTQVCKMLQGVLDAILPPEADTPVYKCNNHDVAYLEQCYTKKGKAILGVAMAKHDFLRRLVMDVAHRIICNKVYSPEYKMLKKA